MDLPVFQVHMVDENICGHWAKDKVQRELPARVRIYLVQSYKQR